MPPFIVFAVAGAAIYAGVRLIAMGLESAARDASDVAGGSDDMDRRRGEPKDLGQLEWDAASEVYRPRHTTSH